MLAFLPLLHNLFSSNASSAMSASSAMCEFVFNVRYIHPLLQPVFHVGFVVLPLVDNLLFPNASRLQHIKLFGLFGANIFLVIPVAVGTLFLISNYHLSSQVRFWNKDQAIRLGQFCGEL